MMRKLTGGGSQRRATYAKKFHALVVAAALLSAPTLVADDAIDDVVQPQASDYDSLHASLATEFLVALPLQDADDTETTTDGGEAALDDALNTLRKERPEDGGEENGGDEAGTLEGLMDSDDESEDASIGNGIDNAMTTSARVPKSAGGRFVLPELQAPSIATDSIGTGRLPRGFRQDAMAVQIPLPESGDQRGIPWEWQVKHWAAANTFHHPLYFEDRMLERHGHERFGCMQPVASGIRFFGTTAILPYMMTVSRPWDCEYSLGYFRSGDCVPTYLQRPPCERKAAIVQGLTLGAAVWVLP
ncbi:hypothetical protein [Stieleria varia]|uniref:Uncharacterized protein n=1 Tax=Stieleria varia TaxID=2528005 RepID=A0A5C6B8D7_9BACT|nr:hypothetical protein [Stieleria varia]TWU07701.1 hypothetical protein Pla52n_02740 [Stieleria varia]